MPDGGPREDRRQAVGRRATDLELEQILERLDAIEDTLEKKALVEIGRIRSALGERNKTLMFDLDERYMPREELRKEYVPRVEQTEQRRWSAQLRSQIIIGLFAGAPGWVTAIVVIVSHNVR